MTLPKVEVRIRTRSLGLSVPGEGETLAILGPADAGAFNAPALYGRTGDVETDFEGGPLVEAAAIALEVTGRPVVLVRCETTTPGAMGALDLDNVTGTAVPRATSGATPNDDTEALVLVVDGGEVCTDGITYQSSLDGGRTMSPITALGLSSVIGLEGGVSFTLDPPADQVTALIALATEARADAIAHFANETAHDAADTAAAALITLGVPTTAAEAWAVLNQVRLAHAAHLGNITAHNGPDPVNTLSRAAATDASSGIALAVEHKADHNAHLGIALAAAPAGLKAATATVASVVVWTAAANLLAPGVALLDTYPRRPTFTTAGTTPASAPASVLIEGFDRNGVAQSETLNLAQSAAMVTATKAYKGTGLTYTFAAADDTDATIAAGYGQGVHNSADITNLITSTAPTQGTLLAGDYFSARTSMPVPNDAQIDAVLLKLQTTGLAWKSALILPPISSTATANAIGTRIQAMEAAYKYKKFFGSFRMPNLGESAAAYLTAWKAVFDAVTLFELVVSAGSLECQSCATRPRTYRRPPAWLAAPLHVKLGPAVSLAYVNDGAGALPLGATIKDSNGNEKHHDESLNEGLDAARALTVTSQPGYPGKVFFTRPRTLAELGTDYMSLQYWACVIEGLDAVVPRLIGQLGAGIAPDVETGRVDDAAAKDIEGINDHEIENKVIAKGYAVAGKVVIDRSINIISSPRIPVDVSITPFAYVDAFILSIGLNNPYYSNT